MDYDLQLELIDNEVWCWDEIDKLQSEAPPVTTTKNFALLGVG